MADSTTAQNNVLSLWKLNPLGFIVAIASRNNPLSWMAAVKYVCHLNGYTVNKFANDINQYDKLIDGFIYNEQYSIVKQILVYFTFRGFAPKKPANKYDTFAAWTASPALWQSLNTNIGNLKFLLSQITTTQSTN